MKTNVWGQWDFVGAFDQVEQFKKSPFREKQFGPETVLPSRELHLNLTMQFLIKQLL